MNRKKYFFIFLIVLTMLNCLGEGKANTGPLKQAHVSGTFYPASPQKLKKMIHYFLARANVLAPAAHVRGLISPHAGYIYSGPVAAFGFKTIQGKNYRTVIIIGPSHYYPVPEIAVYDRGAFATPLGNVEVDTDFVNQLIKDNKRIVPQRAVFDREHAIEVEIPFLQETLHDFSIVPIIIGNGSYALCEQLSRSLVKAIGKREDVLIIASSDMSHYHPYQEARAIDNNTLALIRQNSPKKLFQAATRRENELCGAGAVVTLMLAMKQIGAGSIEVLHYATSADTTASPKDRVVGYCSVRYAKETVTVNEKRRKPMLSETQKKKLLEIARNSITEYVRSKQRIPVETEDPLFREHRGAFVTIHKDGALRGCIGRIVADHPLIEVVNAMAVEAATGDPRFPPVQPAEIDTLDLEISVLSPIKQISDVQEIEVGTHGLIIRKGLHSGLLLPQVATDYGWNREEFLQHTCLKAGLNPQAWKQNAQIYIFSAEVFGENE